jgi:hypothetical protein
MISITPLYPSTITKEKEQVRSLEIIKDFALNTSIHGLPRIARSRNGYNRAFCSISFFVFIGIMLDFIVTF